MNSRQHLVLRVLSSIAVGTMAFCLTVPAVMLLGGILFRPWWESDILFPPQLAILLLISVAAGASVGIFVGIKYYRYLAEKRDERSG